MADLTKHVMINKWDDDINTAIQEVGGNTYGSEGLPDYADIIKTQLISNTAIEDGIYQDFLYVDENNNSSIYPWEGEPTSSKNAIQSNVVAASIKHLYDTMAVTERFNVLLVDEIPTKEINLSAIYLLRSKCCENVDCDCIEENTYTGCYFIKQGKNLKRIDIPEFKINLDELFFLTRAEYDAGLSDYVKEIEELLRKKFGKYWNDEGFALDETIDQVVSEIKEDLKQETDKILIEINSKIESALNEVDEKIINIESELDTKLNNLEESVNNAIEDINVAIATSESKLNIKIDELEQDIEQDLTEIRQDINLRVKISDLVSLNNEINELK